MKELLKKVQIWILGKLVYVAFKIQILFTGFVHINKPNVNDSFILAVWHAHQASLYGFKEVISRVNILISPSNDGQIVTDACEGLGYKVIRGSKRRRGAAQSVLKMLDALVDNNDIVAIMIDGPKGPKHVVQAGVIELAKLSGKPIIPYVWYSPQKNYLKFNSWDEFRFPLGPVKMVSLYGNPIYVDSNVTDEEFEQKRLELENKIKELYDDVVANYGTYVKNAK